MKEVYMPGAILPILFYCPFKTASNSGSSDNDRLQWVHIRRNNWRGLRRPDKVNTHEFTPERACVSFHTNKITLSRRM